MGILSNGSEVRRLLSSFRGEGERTPVSRTIRGEGLIPVFQADWGKKLKDEGEETSSNEKGKSRFPTQMRESN